MPRPGMVTNSTDFCYLPLSCIFLEEFITHFSAAPGSLVYPGTVPHHRILLAAGRCKTSFYFLINKNVNKTKMCKWLDLQKYASLMCRAAGLEPQG